MPSFAPFRARFRSAPLAVAARRYGPAWILFCACALATLSGCGTVAINDPGAMTDQQFQKGAATNQYHLDAEQVWIHVKETLAHLSSRQPEFNDDTLRAFATVEAGSIQIGVIHLGPEDCILAVRARQYGVFSDELARTVLERVDQEIEP